MKKFLALILLIMCISLSSICISCKNEEDVEIYTTVYALDFVTKLITGDKVKVKSIYPASAEVHEYEPTPKQLIGMSKADLVIYIGQGLEPFIENGVNSTFKNTKLVKITGYSTLKLVNYEGTHGHVGSDADHANESSFDPHIWLDLDAMEEIVNIILLNILSIEKFSVYESEFKANANKLIDKIKNLATLYHQALDNAANKLIIVDHDAYAYWSYRYNIERKSLRGDNESSDPNSKEFIDTINLAVENKIKYILATKYESQESLIKSYVKQVNDKDSSIECDVLYLDNLETLVDKNENYLTIMENNLNVLKKALNIEKED